LATITITRYEIKHKLLPPVCILTGVPTTNTQWNIFRWAPEWVNLTVIAMVAVYAIVRVLFAQVGMGMPTFLVAFFFVPSLIVYAGLKSIKPIGCDMPIVRRKRLYWIARQIASVVLVLICLALIISGYTNTNEMSGFKNDPDYGLWAGRAGLVLLVVGGIVLYTMKQSSIHVTEMNPTGLTLANVHENFVRMMEVERKSEVLRKEVRDAAHAAEPASEQTTGSGS
jgi:uncharacterized membrane protein